MSKNAVLGIHHVTAFSGNPQKNVDFYADILGLRLIKVTVNHDDVKTYHLYYGTGDARPGSFITFFPWPESHRGRVGNGQSTATAYSVPANSLDFWADRLTQANVPFTRETRFNQNLLSLIDPDEAIVELIESPNDPRHPSPWHNIPADKAILGFHSVTFTIPKPNTTDQTLTDLMGYTLQQSQDNRHRYILNQGLPGEIVDIIINPDIPFGRDGVGTTHHVAFRTRDDDHEMALREDIAATGLNITPQIDRNYFHSLYFRTPGGPLFEIATDPPGMTYDEPIDQLGEALVLPAHAEPHRQEIERGLQEFTTPSGIKFPQGKVPVNSK